MVRHCLKARWKFLTFLVRLFPLFLAKFETDFNFKVRVRIPKGITKVIFYIELENLVSLMLLKPGGFFSDD